MIHFKSSEKSRPTQILARAELTKSMIHYLRTYVERCARISVFSFNYSLYHSYRLHYAELHLYHSLAIVPLECYEIFNSRFALEHRYTWSTEQGSCDSSLD